MIENNQMKPISAQEKKQRCVKALKNLISMSKVISYFTHENYEDKLVEIALLIQKGNLDEAKFKITVLTAYFKNRKEAIEAQHHNYVSKVKKILDDTNKEVNKIKEQFRNSINNPRVDD